jgi:prolyl oligopeptidase
VKRALLALGAIAIAGSSARIRYPEPPTAAVSDTYHGSRVEDPYRPLENPDAAETRRWIDQENSITQAYLGKIPAREPIRRRLTRLWNFERFSTPFQEGGRYFYTRNDGLQNQGVLYIAESLSSPPRVLLDPNALSADGTAAIAGLSVSRDGKKLAYAISAAGSDWSEWRVRDIDTGKDADDLLKWTKFTEAAWLPDGSGFYYARYAAPAAGGELSAVNKSQKVYFHRLGDPQERDQLVYERPDRPDFEFSSTISDDGRWHVLTVFQGTDQKTRVYYRDLSKPGSEFLRLFDAFDARWVFVDDDGERFFIWTDKDAPKGRLVSVEVGREPEAARTLTDIIPQGESAIESISRVGGRFVVAYLRDASSRVALFSSDGRPEKEIELPGMGSASGFGGKNTDRETFFLFTSFTWPTTIYRYDFDRGQGEVFKRPTVDFDPGAYETEQVFCPSKDGTRIPLFLVYRKGMARNGRNATLLYGYGGFAVNMTPYFSVRNLAWVEMGGIYAHAILRGGDEYGEDWHRAGMLANKQNVFDDFAVCARWLIDHGYTSPRHLAINGGSNGGLLIGATLNQHPELFGAAVASVGVMDMLRFQKFTIGWEWVSDYGSSDDPEQFRWLRAYSPLHNVRKGARYPAVLVTTGDHDDRVVPAHSFKYAAALQAAQAGPAPILIRIETRAGHGAGKPTTKVIDETADVLAFLTKNLGGVSSPR